MTIYERVYAALSPLGYPVFKQGGFAVGETLPDTYITYQVISSPNTRHYSNAPTRTAYRIQATLYAHDPVLVQTADKAITAQMRPAGFLRITGRDITGNLFNNSQQNTGHEAYAVDFRFVERPAHG